MIPEVLICTAALLDIARYSFIFRTLSPIIYLSSTASTVMYVKTEGKDHTLSKRDVEKPAWRSSLSRMRHWRHSEHEKLTVTYISGHANRSLSRVECSRLSRTSRYLSRSQEQ